MPLLGKVILVCEKAIPVAKALAIFRDDLRAKLALDRFRLWDYVRDGGELKIKERSREFRQNADGSMRIEEVEVERVYARLSGYEILDPRLTSCVDQLKTALRKLREHDHGEVWRLKLDAMDDRQKMKAAKTIASAVTSIKNSLTKLTTLRSFTDRVTINTLRGWGQHEGCPEPRFFEHHNDRITFGQSENRNYAVPIPADLQAYIGVVEF